LRPIQCTGLQTSHPTALSSLSKTAILDKLPRLVAGPFRYTTYASEYVKVAKEKTKRPVKQAVISASALSLLCPESGLPNCSKEQFLEDLVSEAERDIGGCLTGGASVVQIDFTEGRLALKLDPSGNLLRQFIDLNNRVLARLSVEEKLRIAVHSCRGGDRDATHSAAVDYADLLPLLFELDVTNFYLQLASEKDHSRVLQRVKDLMSPKQRVFVGVTDPIDPRVETPEEICDWILEATRYIPADQLGTTDDWGLAPFLDDVSTARDVAFAKIAARVEGTALAARQLGA
jgi:5-methyltetrahydropteroyltriglutamate--homocysteine methyltransferase